MISLRWSYLEAPEIRARRMRLESVRLLLHGVGRDWKILISFHFHYLRVQTVRTLKVILEQSAARRIRAKEDIEEYEAYEAYQVYSEAGDAANGYNGNKMGRKEEE